MHLSWLERLLSWLGPPKSARMGALNGAEWGRIALAVVAAGAVALGVLVLVGVPAPGPLSVAAAVAAVTLTEEVWRRWWQGRVSW